MKTITLLLKFRLPLLLFCFAIFCPNKSSGQNITNVQQLSLTSTQVTIGFDVNPNNASTTVRIQYSLQNNNFGVGVQTATFPTNFTGNSVISQSLLITGLIPDRVYYYRVWGANANGNSYVPASGFFNFITPAVAPAAVLTFSNLTSSAITGTTATVSVDLANVCPGASYRLQYSTSLTFSPTVDVVYQTGGTAGTKNHNITGLLPNTTYYFRFYARVNQACNTSEIYSAQTGSFFTAILPVANMNVAIYDFNGSLTDRNNGNAFSGTGVGYAPDRNGNLNQALDISISGLSATITGLPIGNTARTVALWMRPTSLSSDNILFAYGAMTANNAYGFSFTSSTVNNFCWGANDLNGSATFAAGVWKHVVCTYNASGLATIYIDGISVQASTRSTWNTSSSSFNLGRRTSVDGLNFLGRIDALHIYNYALTQAEVTQLFNVGSLSSENFNQNNLEVALYPNPANDVLNIEMNNEVKSIEIYNIQGQKIMSSNQKQINVSYLVAGMYMVRIQDNDNSVATKKFTKQ